MMAAAEEKEEEEGDVRAVPSLTLAAERHPTLTSGRSTNGESGDQNRLQRVSTSARIVKSLPLKHQKTIAGVSSTIVAPWPASSGVPLSTSVGAVMTEGGEDDEQEEEEEEEEEGKSQEWENRTTAPTTPAPSSPPIEAKEASFTDTTASSSRLSLMPGVKAAEATFRFTVEPDVFSSSPQLSAVSERELRLLLPYWPKSACFQEVALAKASGPAGPSILREMVRGARSVAQEHSFTLPSRNMASRADATLHHRDVEHSPHDSPARSLSSCTAHSAEGHNNKKRKSSKSAPNDLSYSGGLSDSLRRSSTVLSGRISDYDGHTCRDEDCEEEEHEEYEDDGVERPDVSSATFRASRLVDEVYSSGFHQDLRQGHGRHVHHSCHRCPWSHRPRLRLRSHIRLRLILRRALNDFWANLALVEAEREEEERMIREKAAAEAFAAKAAAAEAEKKRRERSSKAEKRMQAMKGAKGAGTSGNGAGKKLTLADLRARTLAAGQQGNASQQLPATCSKVMQREADDCPGTAAVLPESPAGVSSTKQASALDLNKVDGKPCQAPAGPFLFDCVTETTRGLRAIRSRLQQVLCKPFEDVVRGLSLPRLGREIRVTDSSSPCSSSTSSRSEMDDDAEGQAVMSKSRAPMVWPEADSPTKKFMASTISRAILDKMGVQVPRKKYTTASPLSFSFSLGDKHELASSKALERVRDWGQYSGTETSNVGATTSWITSEAKGIEANEPSSTSLPSPSHHAGVDDPSWLTSSTLRQPDCRRAPSLGTPPATSFLLLPSSSRDEYQDPAPTVSRPLSPQSPSTPPTQESQQSKTPSKMSRRRRAQLNNIHHQANSARWATSPPIGHTPATTSNTYDRGGDSSLSGVEAPLSSSALFPDEYICLFCDYALFYGTRPLLLKACRHRKQTVRRRAPGEEGKKKKQVGRRKGGSGALHDAHGDVPEGTCTECGCCLANEAATRAATNNQRAGQREEGQIESSDKVSTDVATDHAGEHKGANIVSASEDRG